MSDPPAKTSHMVESEASYSSTGKPSTASPDIYHSQSKGIAASAKTNEKASAPVIEEPTRAERLADAKRKALLAAEAVRALLYPPPTALNPALYILKRAMAPPPLRKSVPKERFASVFGTLKAQTYHDPASRGPGSHTIRTIAWSPTGHLIATGSSDRTLRIWNPEKPQVKNSTELRGHTGAIERVAFDPTKEAELASVSADGTCRFWDARSKTCIAVVQLGGEGLTIAWAADGKTVLCGRKDDTLIVVEWVEEETLDEMNGTNGITTDTTTNGTNGASSNAPPPTPTTATATTFSSFPSPPKGTYVASPDQHPQTTQTNQCIFPHTSPPQHMLLTSGTGSIKICAYPSFRLLHTLHAHTSSASCLALSPTGRYLATGGSDALVCLWDTTDWVCRRTLAGSTGAVRSVSFSFDGGYICGGSDDGGAAGGSGGSVATQAGGAATAAAGVGSAGGVGPGASGTGIEISHVESGEVVYTIPTQGPAACVVWHPSRYWVAWSGDSGGLKILGPAGGVL
ncbi:hypothetical protein MMC25_005127 [Agyrium rufum]|nr:hypothetical protein [Agyrium rufum]